MKNVCVVGYGAIGRTHAQALGPVENADLYAVCDIKEEKIAEARELYPNIVSYTDFDKMLEDQNIDSVHICTPHYLHFEMIKKALEKNKKVVTEKPIVMKKEEMDKLLELENADEVCVVFQNRTNNCTKKAKEIVESDKYGKILAVKGIVTWKRTKEYYSDDWHGKLAKEGGGVLINQTIHTLDFLMYFGGKAKTVKASMNNFSLEGVIEVEDTVTAYIEYENGAKGIFFGTNAYPYNSGVEFEVNFGNDSFSVIAGKLYRNREHICSDSEEYVIKKYW